MGWEVSGWGAFFQAVTGLGTVLIAIIAFFHSRRSFQLQSINLYIGNWRDLTRTFLVNDRANKAFESLSGKSSSQSGDVNFLIFMFLNQAVLAYYAWRFGAMPRSERDAEFHAIWQIIAGHRDRAFSFLRSESYPPAFIKAFERVGRLEAQKEPVNGES